MFTPYALPRSETVEYLIIAYGLIASVLIGYTIHLHWRMNHVERERASLEDKT